MKFQRIRIIPYPFLGGEGDDLQFSPLPIDDPLKVQSRGPEVDEVSEAA